MGGFQSLSEYGSGDKYSCWEINPAFPAQSPLLGTFYVKNPFIYFLFCLVSWEP
jgi:hypothetical protein